MVPKANYTTKESMLRAPIWSKAMSQLGEGGGSCIPTGKRNKVKDRKAGIRKFNTLDEKEKV